jgi:predicted nuclease with TOPRIM domain
MNRSKFMDYLLEKGECNRFNEHQIDALEQFCFALYENTELDKPVERIAELEKENASLNDQNKRVCTEVAELEKELDVLTAFIIKRMPPIKAMSSIYETCKIVSDEVDLILKAHNLEQQAKALSDAHKVIVENKMLRSARDYIDFRASELLEMSQALKEGK